MEAFLACDWGTTNLRAWVVAENGAVLRDRNFPLGVGRLQAGEAARRFADEVRPAMEARGLPAILCGMIGSNLGWRAVPYRPCPADLASLAEGLRQADEQAWIVPGLICDGITAAPDVMRGEETQVLGWVAADPARSQGLQVICHPGTHTKWVIVQDGRIVRFVTAMTGELFSVLGRHSILRHEAAADDDEVFLAGVAAAGDGGGLAARLFSARARVVGGGADPAGTPSYLSGLLIGAEAASLPRLVDLPEGATVHVLGDAALCERYRRVLAMAGIFAEVHDGEAAALSGLAALFRSRQP